jgi:hypothetical protein
MPPAHSFRLPLYLLIAIAVSGCAAMATQRLADNLSHAMLNQDDPATVQAGAPAYLLLIDSLIEDQPKDRYLLKAGAQLYNAYAGGLVENPARAKRLTHKARDYARRAMCATSKKVCRAEAKPYDQFVSALSGIDQGNLDIFYTYGTCWAGWIAARSDDWNALAELPKVESVLEKVVALDPGYGRGRAQLYLAIMRSQLPPGMGGKPEEGKSHFEQAIQFSDGRDLIAKVEYARLYARLTYNQELHDRLLDEVLNADPVEPDLTLSNVVAQEKARKLKQDDYF